MGDALMGDRAGKGENGCVEEARLFMQIDSWSYPLDEFSPGVVIKLAAGRDAKNALAA